MVQPPAPHIKSVSFLEVKGKDVPLPCEKEEIVSIQYTIVGETQGSVDIMYLVSRSMRKKKTEQFSYILIFRKSEGELNTSTIFLLILQILSRGAIVTQGLKKVDVQNSHGTLFKIVWIVWTKSLTGICSDHPHSSSVSWWKDLVLHSVEKDREDNGENEGNDVLFSR